MRYYVQKINGELWVFDRTAADAPMCIEKTPQGWHVFCWGDAWTETLDEAVAIHDEQADAYNERQWRATFADER